VSRAVRVPDEVAGTRLDRFLASLDGIGTRAAAERLLAGGTVTVDGSPRAKSHRLEGGEEVAFDAPRPVEVVHEPIDVPVVYEDAHLLVVDKPAGLVVHPGAGRPTGTLVQALHGRIAGGDDPERPGIVHRLDRNTSGLMVVARTDEAYRLLREQVRAHALDRRYLALVRGRPRSRRGTIDAPIGRDRFEPTRQSLDSDTPREAVTHFEVERLWSDHALLRVRLETGRMHQIRVHLAAIGLPVAGDPTYGAVDDRLERQFLHAARLALDHPVTGERLELESPLPADLSAVLSLLG
jgi:23S rRNA pseudouridine1911/1915/1917 synthase